MESFDLKQWLLAQKETMIDLVIELAEINSHSNHIEGLEQVSQILIREFQKIADSYEPIGSGMMIFRKREHAPFRILIAGHYDTVFPQDHPFQKVTRASPERLLGPGVADMKGGIVILLKALEAYEKMQEGKVGWTIIFNSDEEIGSPNSTPFLSNLAKEHQIGLVFEPSWPNGDLVSSRKGSVNLTVTMRGLAAHAGRNFYEGKSAIYALAETASLIEKLNDENTTVNVGILKGGISPNIVADEAMCRINIRAETEEILDQLIERIRGIAGQREGIQSLVTIDTYRPPKPFDEKTEKLFLLAKECAESLQMNLDWKPSGGVCDGNTLADAGLPTIDTLGAVGGNIHTSQEYLIIESLVERACLTALILKTVERNGRSY